MSEDTSQTYMTSPARTGKMLAIMLGICLVGGAIFFGLWDYWISQPAPVVDVMDRETDREAAKPAAAEPTGISHDFALDFVESDDLRTLAFNALPGEEGHNPEIRVGSGDEVTVTSNNLGRSFHAFGIVADPEDFGSVVMDSGIGAPASPLKPGEGGTVTFTAGAPGAYHYICTVPGHAFLGMQGSFIVE